MGIDAGGSKTALVAAAEGSDDVFELVGDAANLQRLGMEATASVLAGLVRDAADHHGGTTRVKACIGIAGAGRSEDARLVASKSRQLLEPGLETRLLVVHDGEIALQGAFNGASGVVVIAGTGSLILARTLSGRLVRAGGWGYLLGDEGSGHAIGLAAIRAVTRVIDAAESTPLLDVLAREHALSGRDEIIHAVYRDHLPLQSIAPSVLKLAAEKDASSMEVVRSETNKLAAQLTAAVAHRSDVERRAALVGGLTRNDTYRAALSSAILKMLPHWQIVEPLASPAVGALQRAREL